MAAVPGALHDAVTAVAQAHSELSLVVREFYPYISDMSYLRLDPGLDFTALTANLPTWRDPVYPTRPGAYTLPLGEIARLDLPIVNFGPYGAGVHERGERVLMSYSFGILPQLIHEVIERLGNLTPRKPGPRLAHHTRQIQSARRCEREGQTWQA